MQILTREGRLVLAGKHRKALRRYQYEVEQLRPQIARGHFEYLNVPLRAPGYQWAPGKRHMMPMVVLASIGSRYYSPSGGGGGSDYDGHVPSVVVDNEVDFQTEIAAPLAGTIVGCDSGVLIDTPSGTANDPIFKIGGSGSSGSPIIVVAKRMAVYNQGAPATLTELRSDDPFTGSADPLDPLWNGNSAVIGTHQQDWVTIKGFQFDLSVAPPRPSNGVVLLNESDNCRIEKCYFDQILLSDGDNFSSIFIRGCVNAYAANCKGVGGSDDTGATNHNAAFLITYGSLGTLLEHLEAEDVNQFVFIKGTHFSGTRNSGTMRYCKATDCSQDLVDFTTVDATAGFDAYQNLAIRCRMGVNMDASSPTENGYARVYANTLVDLISRGYEVESGVTMTGTELYDNVIAFMATTSAIAVSFGAASDDDTDLHHNLYHEAGGSAQFHASGTTRTGLDDWVTATGQESGSTEADPSFADAGADDYRRLGSDTGSSTSGRRGCYITNDEEIGLEAA